MDILLRRLKRLKYRVKDTWPSQPLVWRGNRATRRFASAAELLPPLKQNREQPVEFHMLCGRGQIAMGIFASWSIMRFFQSSVLYLHSDGTLQESDIQVWRSIIPAINLIDKKDRDTRIKAALAEAYPMTYEWRCKNWASSQLVDMHFYGSADRFVVLDSDVLCFKDPKELKSYLGVEKAQFRWNKDLADAYSVSRPLLQNLMKKPIPSRLCAGFLLTPRLDVEDYAIVEDSLNVLARRPDVEINHYWSSQTYYAIVVGNRPEQSGPLPRTYDLCHGRTPSSCVVRHFVGVASIRPRFFLEGVPAILHQSGIVVT
jgi:hypothetical protein